MSNRPRFPKKENLREFYVSAVATNQYLIDASTLAVGTTAWCVTYWWSDIRWRHQRQFRGHQLQGPHLEALRHRRPHGGPGPSRVQARIEWRPIENKPVNRHHAALSRDLFCPQGNAINTADEGRNALRLGKHPNAT
jgi:hypothetical protein